MNFELPPELADLVTRVRAFVDDRILPAEATIVAEDREGVDATLRALQAQAREAGLWAPHLPTELGGLGLGVMGMSALFRVMGRSLVGPRVFNCDAPDQGNMDLLLKAGSPEVQKRYLEPLVAAEITSAFCMTEPAPGAGADPSNLRTTARPDPEREGGWIIDGHKWYSTGGGKAAFLIVMARTSEDRRSGATLFLVDRQAEGVEHLRDIETLAEPLLVHREAELTFTNVRVGPEALLGGVGEGFHLAQVRLVPARLTHCMRWLGLADRALGLCRDYVNTRVSFGKELARHQLVQAKIARNATGIHAGNLMTFHCAWLLEQGRHEEAKAFSSMCKHDIAQLLCRVMDDGIQLHGGKGFSLDLPFAEWSRHVRASRIADGPDEVHVGVVARAFLRGKVDLLGS